MSSTFTKPLNNAESFLAADYDAGSGSMTLNAGDGALFGSPSPSAPIRITVAKRATLHNGQIGPRTTRTIYQCTSVVGDTLSGLTAIEGTTDQGFKKNDPVAALVTAGVVQDAYDQINLRATDASVVHLAGSESITGAKTIATTSLSAVPLTLTAPASNTTNAVLDLQTHTATGTDNANRQVQFWTSVGPSSGTLGFYPPVYINETGVWCSQVWFLLSGNYDVLPDGRITVKYPIEGIPFDIGIWADHYGPAIDVRPAPIGPPTGYQYLGQDLNGLGIFLIDENAVQWWGSASQNPDNSWVNPDPINSKKPVMTQSWGPDNSTTVGMKCNGWIRSDVAFVAEGKTGNKQKVTINANDVYQAASITGSAVSGTYASWFFVCPDGSFLGVGANGIGNTAQLAVRAKDSSTAPFSVETSDTTLALKVTSNGKTQIGASGSPLSAILSSTASLSFPSTGDRSYEDLAVNITGVRSGDRLSVTPPSTTPGGAMFQVLFDVNDWVIVRYFNNSGAALAVSGIFAVEVRQY